MIEVIIIILKVVIAIWIGLPICGFIYGLIDGYLNPWKYHKK